MWSNLRQLARRLYAELFKPDSGDGPRGPRDPYSYVRHPLVQRPGGRSSSVALEEPDEDQNLELIAPHPGRRSAPGEGA
jgi:hypothetical protein